MINAKSSTMAMVNVTFWQNISILKLDNKNLCNIVILKGDRPIYQLLYIKVISLVFTNSKNQFFTSKKAAKVKKKADQYNIIPIFIDQ